MASDGGVDAQASGRRPWWRRYGVPLGCGGAVVLLGGLALALHPGSVPAGPGPEPSEMVRRAPVTDADRVRAQDVQSQLRLSLVHPTRILENRPAGRTGPEVEDVRQGLDAAGFTNAVARVAAATDPAPAGSVIYAVRVGDACLVGHETGLVPDWSTNSVLGLRDDGRCIDP